MVLIVNTMRENILRFLKYVLGKEETDVVRLVKDIYVEGNRRIGIPKKSWGCNRE